MSRRDEGTAQTPVVPPRPTKEELENSITLSLNRQDAARTAASQISSSTISKAPSSETLEKARDSTQNPGKLKGVIQKVNPFKSTSQASTAPSSESLEEGRGSNSTQNPGMLKEVIRKVNPFKSSAQEPKADPQDVPANLQQADKELQNKKNPGMMSGMIQKVNPFKSSQPKDTLLIRSDLSSSSGSLADVPENQNTGMFKGMIQKINPFKSRTQVGDNGDQTDSVVASHRIQDDPGIHSENSTSTESLDDDTIERHSIWYIDPDTSCEGKSQPTQPPKTKTFIIRRILPTSLFGSGTKDSSNTASDTRTLPQEAVEVETLQLAEIPVPGNGTQLDPLDDEEGLLSWWRTVEGWNEWNVANQDEEAEEVVEQAADRVFMAARLFVRLFNQRGASLQQRILELLALADAADNFHKKTVTASVGGGVASVAGSVTTITGLILAPFTAGTSLIVTAVGIGIATAGGVTSASANITDTMHSKTERKKVEKMIQDYQDEIRDIKECLEFLQEGMEKLEEWNFEKYMESIEKKHLNQNVKHVMKEGGRAGKALVVNTESLISTVQVLSVAGGAAKAAQAMSVTTGVMSGLFLALDVFFLAKDSMELKKGAKTEFAAKIREVCKDLQDGLLELNSIKEQLQRTMDGIEVEVEEEDDEELLKSDLKKLK